MTTVVFIAGITVGSAALERHFLTKGHVSSANTVKTFGQFFLVGAGGYLVYLYVTAAIALILV